MPLEVAKTLDGWSWLVTGSTGFVGSMLVEQLFRTCNPSRLVLLVRGKRDANGQQRVEQLLAGPLFDAVRKQHGGTAALLNRVEVLDIDLSAAAAEERELPAVDCIVHSAADLEMFSHIHDSLNSSVMVTKWLADTAARQPSLRAFVHVSTAYVQSDSPNGTTLHEELLPLQLEGRPLDHLALVSELLALPREAAEHRAAALRALWGFPSNYALTKRLAEHMLLGQRAASGPRLRIVRPSFVGGCSLRHPRPGYTGNCSGAAGMMRASAYGFNTCTAWSPENVVDLVPADFVSGAILLAAAAEAEPSPLILHCTTSGGPEPLANRGPMEATVRKMLAEPGSHSLFRVPQHGVVDREVYPADEFEARMRRCDRGVWLRCLFLKLLGKGRLARHLDRQWKLYRAMTAPSLDFNYRILNPNLQRLHALLSPEEQELFACVWRKGLDRWDTYLEAYTDAAWVQYVVKKDRPQPQWRSLATKDLSWGGLCLCCAILCCALLCYAMRRCAVVGQVARALLGAAR